jgi:hypothetical protein
VSYVLRFNVIILLQTCVKEPLVPSAIRGVFEFGVAVFALVALGNENRIEMSLLNFLGFGIYCGFFYVSHLFSRVHLKSENNISLQNEQNLPVRASNTYREMLIPFIGVLEHLVAHSALVLFVTHA